jgi:hypothetical protein
MELLGPAQACNGIALPLPLSLKVVVHKRAIYFKWYNNKKD